jgi:hypothetical protein
MPPPIENRRTLPRMNAVSLGPIIELAQLATARTLSVPERADWLALGGLSVLYRWVVESIAKRRMQQRHRVVLSANQLCNLHTIYE